MSEETEVTLGTENGDGAANSEVETGTKDTETKDTAESTETKDNDLQEKEEEDKNDGDDNGDENSQNGDDENGADDEIFYTAADGQEVKKSDAIDLVRKGLEFDNKYAPIFNKLDMLATSSTKEDGTAYADVGEFVETLINAADNALYNECLDVADGNQDLAEELFESRKAKRNEKYNALLETRKADAEKSTADKTAQVAEEFEILQKEFPDIKAYSELPKEVKVYAAKHNVSLLTAKLLIDHRNQNAIDKANENADKAKATAIGSQSGSGDESVSPAIKAMLERFK